MQEKFRKEMKLLEETSSYLNRKTLTNRQKSKCIIIYANETTKVTEKDEENLRILEIKIMRSTLALKIS